MATATSMNVVQPVAPPSYEEALNNFQARPVSPPPTYEESTVFTVEDDAYRRDRRGWLVNNRVLPEPQPSTSIETSPYRTYEFPKPINEAPPAAGEKPKPCLPSGEGVIACFSFLSNFIFFGISMFNVKKATEAFNKGEVCKYRIHAVAAWTFFLLTFPTPVIFILIITR